MAVFNPPVPPQEDPQGATTFNVSRIRYGDGYEGALGEGMNEKIQDWPVTFVGTDAEIIPIRDFFDQHRGYVRFQWTPPLGVQGWYRVESYTIIPSSAGNAKITATLHQVYAP